MGTVILLAIAILITWAITKVEVRNKYINLAQKEWENYQQVPHDVGEHLKLMNINVEKLKGIVDEHRIIKYRKQYPNEEVYISEFEKKYPSMIPLPEDIEYLYQQMFYYGDLQRLCLLANYFGYEIKLVKKNMVEITKEKEPKNVNAKQSKEAKKVKLKRFVENKNMVEMKTIKEQNEEKTEGGTLIGDEVQIHEEIEEKHLQKEIVETEDIVKVAEEVVVEKMLESVSPIDSESKENSMTKFEVEKGEAIIMEYSERSYAIVGDTKKLKDELKECGAYKYGTVFGFANNTAKGWLISKKKFNAVWNSLHLFAITMKKQFGCNVTIGESLKKVNEAFHEEKEAKAENNTKIVPMTKSETYNDIPLPEKEETIPKPRVIGEEEFYGLLCNVHSEDTVDILREQDLYSQVTEKLKELAEKEAEERANAQFSSRYNEITYGVLSHMNRISAVAEIALEQMKCNLEKQRQEQEREIQLKRKEVQTKAKDIYIMFFDVETSGLKPFSKFEILQLSYIITNLEWEVLKQVNFYFSYPEQESRVDPDSIAVNGLTKDFLNQQTLSDRKKAISKFFSDLEMCHVAVAHNAEFDKGFINSAAKRLKISQPLWPYVYDSMKETTDFCAIPSSSSRYDDYKWPNLQELADRLKIEYEAEGLHDSMVDVELTMECFKELNKKNKIHPYIFESHTPLKPFVPDTGNEDFSTEMGIVISNHLLKTFDFSGKRFVVSGTSEKDKKYFRESIESLGAKWTANIIGVKTCADVLIAGVGFTPSDATDKYPKAFKRQQENPDGFVVFSASAMTEYLHNRGIS